MTLSPWRMRLLIGSLMTVSFLGALDHTIVSTSLATIAGELGALEQLSWVMVSYTLAATVLLPLLGSLGDRLGARRVFLASLAIFVLSSVACGFAQDMVQLAGARIVQGASSAGLQLMSQTIVALVTTPRQRAKVLSIIGAAFPMAIVVGPLAGGLIADHVGWQWVFWINVPIGLAAFVLATLAVPRLEPAGRRAFDAPGAAIFTAAMVAVVLAVTWATEPGLAAVVPWLGGAGLLGLAGFVVLQLRTEHPFVPVRLFADRTVAAGLALSAVVGVGLFSVVAYIPTYIQMVYRTTATVSGLVPIATVMGMLVASLTTGALTSRTGKYRRFAIAGTAAGAVGMAVMAFLPVGLPLAVPMVVMGVVGLGTGAFSSLVVAVVQSAVPSSETGVATATINLVRQIGATIGTAVVGTILGLGLAAQLPGLDIAILTPAAVRELPDAGQAEVAAAYAAVLNPVFLGLALTYVAGVVAALLLPAGRLSDDAPALPADPDRIPAPLEETA